MQLIETEQQLHLRQVDQYPDGLVPALTQLFSHSLKQVKQAFLVKCQEIPSITEYWLLAVELDQQADEQCFADIAEVVMDYLAEEEHMDICRIYADQPGISHQISQHMPALYQRRLGSFLRESS